MSTPTRTSRRPSFTTVVALLALVVALGGTSYAAVSLPKKSVGTQQLKAQAVTSGKVRNGTLQAKDFKDGVLKEPTTPVDNTRLVAQRDGAVGPSATFSSSAQVQTNSVSITAPVAGTLIIHGHAYVGQEGTATTYVARALVDGNPTLVSDNAIYYAPNDGAVGDAGNLSYTSAHPVSAGNHIVTQMVGPTAGTNTFFYNGQELVVQFVPGGTVTVN